MKKSIAERLKEYRLNHNLTQLEMANTLGVSIKTYNDLENSRANPNTDTIDKLSKLLKLTYKTIRESL